MESDVFFLPARGSEGNEVLSGKAEKVFLKAGFLSEIEKNSFIACKIHYSDVHPKINPKLCKNCGICLDYCPAEAIQQENGSARILEEKCIGCGECLVVCPAGAVKMRWDEDSRRVQEKMTEYAYSVWQKFKGKIGFLNFLIKVTKNCDCMARDEPSIVEDIGILASEDPVAIDQASVDLINGRSEKDLLRSVFDIDWSIQLRHGKKIGLGRRNYRRIEIG